MEDAHPTRGAVDAPRGLKVGAAALKICRLVEQQRERQQPVVAVHCQLRLAGGVVLDDEHVERAHLRRRRQLEGAAVGGGKCGEDVGVPHSLQGRQVADRNVGRRVRDVPVRLPAAAGAGVRLGLVNGRLALRGVEQGQRADGGHRVVVDGLAIGLAIGLGTRRPATRPVALRRGVLRSHHRLQPHPRAQPLHAPRQAFEGSQGPGGAVGGCELVGGDARAESSRRTQPNTQKRRLPRPAPHVPSERCGRSAHAAARE